MLDQVLVGRTVEQEKLGLLDGVDEVGGRRAAAETGRIGQPSGLRRELHDVLFPLRVDDVAAETAARHERGKPRHVSSALEKLPRGKTAEAEDAAEVIEILFAEFRPGLEIRPENVECGGRNGG